MHFYWLPFAVLLALLLAMDVVIYRKLRRSCRWPHCSHRVFAWLNAIPVALAVAVAAIPISSARNSLMLTKMWLMWAYFLVTVPKILFFAIYALTWIPRMGHLAQAATRSLATLVAVGAAAAMIWGTVVTPRNISISEVTIESDRLPAGFDGYRIAQISDLHVGTYGTDTTFIGQVVQAVNAQHPDLICFTGDLVNRNSSEAKPFVAPLSRLAAPHGVIAIEGNHDNPSRYYRWPSPTQAAADSLALITMERSMGWRYLAGEHLKLGRGADSIVVAGLTYADKRTPQPERLMQRAMPGWRTDTHFKLVLEHSPAQWDSCFSRLPGIDLMLSGHTHAMQLVLKLWGGKRWSPAALVYPQWGGLYTSPATGAQLYVNTGTGMVGVPMRLGAATPEVTIITLRSTRP